VTSSIPAEGPPTSQDAPGPAGGPAHKLPELGTVTDRRAAATAVADLAARVATVALGVVTTALLARHLGASGFAAFNYALAWGLLFAPLTDFGLRQAAVNRLSVREVSPSEIAGSLLLLRAIMAVVFGSVAAVVAVATAPDNTVAVGSLIVCVGMIVGVPGSLAAIVQTAMKPSWTIINNASSSLSWTVVALIMIAFDAGPVMLVAGVTAAALVSSLLQAWLAQKLTVIGRPTRAALSSLLRLSIPLGLGAIAVAVYYRFNSILVYQISGADEAGYYAAAYRLVDQIQIIPIAIVGALFPLISEAAATNPERLRRFVASAWEILIGLALPVVAIGMVLAHPLAGLLFGDEFRGPTGTVLILIWPVVIAIFLGYLAGALVPAVNLVKVWTLIAFAGAALSVGLCLLLIPPFGANGAAVTTVVTEFLVMAATLWIACRRAHLRLPLGRVLRILAAALLAGGVAALLGLVSLFLGLIGGGLAYLLLLQVFRVVDLPVLIRAVRRPREIAKTLG
jgi:O-antigen/teichoic acid export membrane protein